MAAQFVADAVLLLESAAATADHHIALQCFTSHGKTAPSLSNRLGRDRRVTDEMAAE